MNLDRDSWIVKYLIGRRNIRERLINDEDGKSHWEEYVTTCQLMTALIQSLAVCVVGVIFTIAFVGFPVVGILVHLGWNPLHVDGNFMNASNIFLISYAVTAVILVLGYVVFKIYVAVEAWRNSSQHPISNIIVQSVSDMINKVCRPITITSKKPHHET